MKEYLDFNPFTGIGHWVDTDEETGLTTYGVDQEVDRVMELAKAAHNSDHGRWGEWEHVAYVPMAVYADWLREGKDKDQAFVKRWLNDVDNRHFRTRPGVI